MPDLQALGRKWHTAKALDPVNPLSHDYMPTYARLIGDRKLKNILEIGLGWKGLVHADQVAGCSLHMWAEAFPEAQVWGIDKREDTLVNEGRIASFLFDQSKGSDLTDFRKAMELRKVKFDLIVDDGSHVPIDQARTANALMPLLQNNGLYIIEDVQPNAWDLVNNLLYKFTVIPLHVERVEDDRLVVVHP